ncbi:MAG: (2Fe-2S)-binding protein [Chloroflexi bacterium]|jgi:ferredoxin|nr:(2Fe-2S)-binding protein [Chloroflexota bacterium]
MPKLIVNGKTSQVEAGKKLVLAIEEAGVGIGHRCGGNARCTTCRVEFENGEPAEMTRAEYNKLKNNGTLGQFRLSCQIVVNADMTVKPLVTAENTPQWNGDTGPDPEANVTPEAEWFEKAELGE